MAVQATSGGMKDEEGWDAVVSQLIGIAHSMGTMAVGGQTYYDCMRTHTDGWHFAQGQDTIDILVEVVQDAISAVFAAKPLGSFAVAQRLRDEDEPSATAAAVVVPRPYRCAFGDSWSLGSRRSTEGRRDFGDSWVRTSCSRTSRPSALSYAASSSEIRRVGYASNRCGSRAATFLCGVLGGCKVSRHYICREQMAVYDRASRKGAYDTEARHSRTAWSASCKGAASRACPGSSSHGVENATRESQGELARLGISPSLARRRRRRAFGDSWSRWTSSLCCKFSRF